MGRHDDCEGVRNIVSLEARKNPKEKEKRSALSYQLQKGGIELQSFRGGFGLGLGEDGLDFVGEWGGIWRRRCGLVVWAF